MTIEDVYDPYATGKDRERERVGKTLRPEAEADDEPSGPQTVAVGRLRSFIERIERVNDEITELQDDRKAIFAEAKAEGFDLKAMRTIISLRKKDPVEREQERAMLDLYLSALGME